MMHSIINDFLHEVILYPFLYLLHIVATNFLSLVYNSIKKSESQKVCAPEQMTPLHKVEKISKKSAKLNIGFLLRENC
jgi:hypothetical protein